MEPPGKSAGLQTAGRSHSSIRCLTAWKKELVYFLSELSRAFRLRTLQICIHQGSPAFSHNGKRLAYICSGNVLELGEYTVAIEGGIRKLIATFKGWSAGNVWI
jgi:hypothetical protein